MRNRKKLLAIAVFLIAGAATIFFWPRDQAEARRLLTQLRELVETDQQSAWPPRTPAKPEPHAQIELEFVIAKLNLTDATTGLFAKSTREFKPTFVRVSSKTRFQELLAQLQAQNIATIISEPRIVARRGQAAKFW